MNTTPSLASIRADLASYRESDDVPPSVLRDGIDIALDQMQSLLETKTPEQIAAAAYGRLQFRTTEQPR